MIEIPVHNQDGQQVDTLQVDEATLGGAIRYELLKQACVRVHANRRQGTASTRSRGMVAGSTRKLYKQKGTGNARRGSIRTNIMRGGGMAFAKRPRDFRQDMPTRMRRLANRNAILAKAVDSEIKLVDGFSFDKPSTKGFAKLMTALGIDRTCLLCLSDTTDATALSARNIDDITTLRTDQLNAFDVLNHRYLLTSKDELAQWISQGADAIASRRHPAHELELVGVMKSAGQVSDEPASEAQDTPQDAPQDASQDAPQNAPQDNPEASA